MMEYQPYGGFKVIIPDCEITKEEILSWEDEHEIGFFLEVDLEYPEEIKFKSKNFPFCPQSIFMKKKI
jgi:tRNA(Ile)-lysidine synthase TilS/MesJ